MLLVRRKLSLIGWTISIDTHNVNNIEELRTAGPPVLDFRTIYWGYRNQVGIGLSYQPARPHFLDSIPGPFESLKIPSLFNIRTKGTKDRTSAQPQVKLSFSRNMSLKI
jgi:hypothetical protein